MGSVRLLIIEGITLAFALHAKTILRNGLMNQAACILAIVVRNLVEIDMSFRTGRSYALMMQPHTNSLAMQGILP